MAGPIQSTGGGQPPSHLGAQGKSSGNGNGHRTHQFQGRMPAAEAAKPRAFLRWFPSLTEDDPTEPLDPSPADGNSPRRRLSPYGQAVLTGGILITGLLIFGGSWAMSVLMSNRGEICLRLPDSPDSKNSAPPRGGGENRLLRQYRQGEQLIQTLPAASSGQRIRLGEQLYGLVHELDSICRLNIYYFNQGVALLTLATTSATGVVICVVLLAPRGVQNINLTQRTVLFASAGILGMTVNLLQLGQQQANSAKAQQIYRGQYALLQRFGSSLANQRLEKGLASNPGSQPLNTPAGVAQLISAIDTRRLAMPDPRMTLNGSLAEGTWTRLLEGDDGGPNDSKAEPAEAQPLQAKPGLGPPAAP